MKSLTNLSCVLMADYHVVTCHSLFRFNDSRFVKFSITFISPKQTFRNIEKQVYWPPRTRVLASLLSLTTFPCNLKTMSTKCIPTLSLRQCCRQVDSRFSTHCRKRKYHRRADIYCGNSHSAESEVHSSGSSGCHLDRQNRTPLHCLAA